MSESAGAMQLFIRNLKSRIPVSDAEEDFLSAQEPSLHKFSRGETIVEEGGPLNGSYIIQSGWLARSRTLANGEQQIVGFDLAGETAFLESYYFSEASYASQALTNVELCKWELDDIEALITRYPKLGSFVFWLAGQTDGLAAEQAVSLGQRNAYQRLSHILVEFWHRLQALGLTYEGHYVLPLNQQQLAQTTGLSPVHVSRTLKRMRTNGLIDLTPGHSISIYIKNLQELEEAALFEPHYLHYRE